MQAAKNPVRVWPFRNNNAWPFGNATSQAFLREHGVEIVGSPLWADVIVAESPGPLERLKKLLPWKRFLVWTNEPMYDAAASGEVWPRGTIARMNAFSGNVFWHNLHFLGAYHVLEEIDLGLGLTQFPLADLTVDELAARRPEVIAVLGWRDPATTKLYVKGHDIDLNARRQQTALAWYRAGHCHIAGKGWPAEVQTQESSGYGDIAGKQWWTRKIELLSGYRLNLCFENTALPYYCTEKIWHALMAGCLPIYWAAGTTIAETLPKEAYVDASAFATTDDVLAYVRGLSVAEITERVNVGRRAMSALACKRREAQQRPRIEITARVVERLAKAFPGRVVAPR